MAASVCLKVMCINSPQRVIKYSMARRTILSHYCVSYQTLNCLKRTPYLSRERHLQSINPSISSRRRRKSSLIFVVKHLFSGQFPAIFQDSWGEVTPTEREKRFAQTSAPWSLKLALAIPWGGKKLETGQDVSACFPDWNSSWKWELTGRADRKENHRTTMLTHLQLGK